MTEMLQAEPQPQNPMATALEIARVVFRQLAVMADMYLTVLGTAIVSLSIVVLLDGFDIVQLGLTNTIGGMLATGLVIAVVGLFMLGIAAEGPLRAQSLDSPEINLVIARGVALLLVCIGGFWAASALVAVANTLEGPFEYIVNITRAVAIAGVFIVTPFAIPASWVLRKFVPQTSSGWDRLMILTVWFSAAFVLLRQAIGR